MAHSFRFWFTNKKEKLWIFKSNHFQTTKKCRPIFENNNSFFWNSKTEVCSTGLKWTTNCLTFFLNFAIRPQKSACWWHAKMPSTSLSLSKSNHKIPLNFQKRFQNLYNKPSPILGPDPSLRLGQKMILIGEGLNVVWTISISTKFILTEISPKMSEWDLLSALEGKMMNTTDAFLSI